MRESVAGAMFRDIRGVGAGRFGKSESGFIRKLVGAPDCSRFFFELEKGGEKVILC
jgi:hypothetical protein